MSNDKKSFIKRYWIYFSTNTALWFVAMAALFHFVLPGFDYWDRALLIAGGIVVMTLVEFFHSVSMLGYYSMLPKHFYRGLIGKCDRLEVPQKSHEEARKEFNFTMVSYIFTSVAQCLLGAFIPVWWGALACGALLLVFGIVLLLVRGGGVYPEAQDYYEGFYGKFRNMIINEA